MAKVHSYVIETTSGTTSTAASFVLSEILVKPSLWERIKEWLRRKPAKVDCPGCSGGEQLSARMSCPDCDGEGQLPRAEARRVKEWLDDYN